MSSSRFLSHHCVHLTELVARSPTPLNNTGQCGSAIISEIARTASGRAIVIAVPQRRPNYFGPVFLARSFTHLLTLLISSSWCRTWHAGTWSWYIMHDCYPRGYVTDEQTNMTVFNTIKDTSKTISQMQRQKTNGTAFTRQHSTLSILSRHSWREHLFEILCDWKKQDRQTRMQTE